ncbi:MAG: hypothetical protein H0W08_19010 [Acidobacteria bacterium]|nr:hypothetical protein [Acidobacteriota bacterium]
MTAAGRVDAGGNKTAPTDTLGNFAEDLGRILGTAQTKASAWMDQRKSIAEQLTQIRDTANTYLQQLAGSGANLAGAVARARRGRPPGGAGKRGPGRPPKDSPAPAEAVTAGRKKKRTMSLEARQKIGEAQRRRWAKQKKNG